MRLASFSTAMRHSACYDQSVWARNVAQINRRENAHSALAANAALTAGGFSPVAVRYNTYMIKRLISAALGGAALTLAAAAIAVAQIAPTPLPAPTPAPAATPVSIPSSLPPTGPLSTPTP
jgi:hypothetical protein